MADMGKTEKPLEEQAAGPEAAPAEQAEPRAAAGKPPKGARPKADAGKLAALEQRLADEKDKSARLNDSLLRTAAEYDNYRRRSQKEHDAAFGNGVAYAAEQLLPVLDVLQAAAAAETADAEYKKGVVMTLAKADEVFGKLGIAEIEAQGRPFDPELHNACMREDCGGAESGTVTRVMQRGYTLNGRVVRHAVVAVKS